MKLANATSLPHRRDRILGIEHGAMREKKIEASSSRRARHEKQAVGALAKPVDSQLSFLIRLLSSQFEQWQTRGRQDRFQSLQKCDGAACSLQQADICVTPQNISAALNSFSTRRSETASSSAISRNLRPSSRDANGISADAERVRRTPP
jgi:hypothetical protein